MSEERKGNLLFAATALALWAFSPNLAIGQAAQAPSTPAARHLAAPHIDFEKYTLPNGLQVILAPDRRVPTVHVNLWYHVGSKNESQNRSGFAHLFEHMMYQGSKNANSEYGTLVEKAGGSTNATPDEDRTEFFENIPSGSLEYALWLESDRLATLPEALTQERLDNQISVVENERRQRFENEPYGMAGVLINENLYPANHPYSHSVIGSHDDVRAATIPEVKDFFRTYYSPNNLSMVIAGDFDVPRTKQWIAKYFGPIAPAPPMVRPARWTPHLSGEKTIDLDAHVAEQRVYLAWTAPPYVSAAHAPLELAARILNRQLSADLVYSDKPLCSEESVDFDDHEDGSNFVVMASARPGASLDEIEHKVDARISALAKDGPKADDLEQARSRFQYGELSQFDTLQSIAETLNKGNIFAGDPNYYAERWKEIDDVTAGQIAAAMRDWIDPANRLRVRFHPVSFDPTSFESQKLAMNQTEAPLDRSVPPPLHQDAPLQAPKVQSATLPNGLQIYVARQPGVPKVAIQLTTLAGSVHDPRGKEGLALLTAATMNGGTTTRTGTQVRDGMESAAATAIESSANIVSAGLDFNVLASNIEPAFAVFADVMLHPSFKQYSLETNRQQFTELEAESKTDPNDIATTAAPALIFGPAHPYARSFATPAGVASVTRDDLRTFYQTYWKPERSALFFAGDISLEDAVALANKYLAAWPGSPAPAERAAQAAAVPAQLAGAGHLYLIDRPDAPQTLLMQILPGVGANSPERFPLVLASHVWGGMWDSRLNTLRQKLGVTYGFSASIALYPDSGCLVASGTVQTDKTSESVAELEAQLRMLRSHPITEAELQEAKKTNLQSAAASFETSTAVAARMSQLWEWGLPMSAMQGESEGVQTTSLAQVRAAVAQYAQPDKAVLLLVGDRSKIEPGLRKLNLGNITLLDTDGKPIPVSAAAR